MSESLRIGLTKKQIERLHKGDIVGKRPYDIKESYNVGDIRYNGTIRIYIKMLSDEEEFKEPETAFGW